MKAIALIVGLAVGVLGASYAYPRVAPKLDLGLGDDDLMPLPGPAAEASQASSPGGDERAASLVISKLTGHASRLGLEGEWKPASSGDVLAEGEQLRTDADGSVSVVDSQGGNRVELAALSHLTLRRTTPSIHRFRLIGGLAMLAYTAPGVSFMVESRSGRTVFEGRGTAALLANGDGAWVRCASGQLVVAAAGVRRHLAEGTVAHVRDGEAPGRVSATSALNITARPPEEVGPGAKVATVSGTVSGAARVLVGDSVAAVDERGNYTAKVHLKPGTNHLVVVAQDVTGAEKRVPLPAIEVEAQAARATPAFGIVPPPRHPTRPKGEGIQWGAP